MLAQIFTANIISIIKSISIRLKSIGSQNTSEWDSVYSEMRNFEPRPGSIASNVFKLIDKDLFYFEVMYFPKPLCISPNISFNQMGLIELKSEIDGIDLYIDSFKTHKVKGNTLNLIISYFVWTSMVSHSIYKEFALYMLNKTNQAYSFLLQTDQDSVNSHVLTLFLDHLASSPHCADSVPLPN